MILRIAAAILIIGSVAILLIYAISFNSVDSAKLSDKTFVSPLHKIISTTLPVNKTLRFTSRYGYAFDFPQDWKVLECIDGSQINIYAPEDKPFSGICDDLHKFGRLDIIGPVDEASLYFEPTPDQRTSTDVPPRLDIEMSNSVFPTKLSVNDSTLRDGSMISRALVQIARDSNSGELSYLIINYREDDVRSFDIIQSLRSNAGSF
jgi:hypothetical protein